MTTSAAKVAAAGIAGAGGSGGAVYGTYYLVTKEKTQEIKKDKEVKNTTKDNKEELKKWLEKKKCTITVTVESSSTSFSFTKDSLGDDEGLINGLWTWLEKSEENKNKVECDGTADKTSQLKTNDKENFNK